MTKMYLRSQWPFWAREPTRTKPDGSVMNWHFCAAWVPSGTPTNWSRGWKGPSLHNPDQGGDFLGSHRWISMPMKAAMFSAWPEWGEIVASFRIDAMSARPL